MKLFRDEFLGGPLGMVLTAAALASFALPITRRILRPIARQAVRGVVMLSETVQSTGDEMKDEWQGLVREAKQEAEKIKRRDQYGAADKSMISQAWRTPEFPADESDDANPPY